METLEQKILAHLPEPKMPADLGNRIMARVERSRLRALYLRLALSSAGCVAGFAYLGAEWRALWSAASQLPIFGFLRLAFSDPDIMFANFQEYFLGLIESTPFGLIALGFGLTFCLICAVEFLSAARRARHAPLIIHPVIS
jgi:hypothetical protein